MKETFVSRNTTLLTTLCLTLFVILQALYIFGTNQDALTQSTSNFKLDTRGASVEDVLGMISFKPVRTSESDTASTTSIPKSGYSVGAPTLSAYAYATSSAGSRTSPAYAYATSSSTNSYYISPKLAAEAEESLKRLKNTLNSLKNRSNSSSEISLARVFYVNDFLVLGTGGFKCYSENIKGVAGVDSFESGVDMCPTNGFLKCLGNSPKYYKSISDAYQSINRRYLSQMTDLSYDEIREISDDYRTVMSASIKNSLRMNLPPSSLNTIMRFACGADNMVLSRRNRRNAVPSTALNYIFGMISLVISSTAVVFFCMGTVRILLWFFGFAFFIGQTIVSFEVFVKGHNALNRESEGLRSHTGGYIGFFVAMIIVQLLLSLLFVYDFLWFCAWRRKYLRWKQTEEYEAKILYSSWGDDPYSEHRKVGKRNIFKHPITIITFIVVVLGQPIPVIQQLAEVEEAVMEEVVEVGVEVGVEVAMVVAVEEMEEVEVEEEEEMVVAVSEPHGQDSEVFVYALLLFL
jgi:hypothetical protein